MQNHYNLVYREEEREMIPLCQEEGIGLLPWSPLARGMLAGTRKSRDDEKATTRASTDTIAEGLYDHPSDWDVVEAVQSVAAARGSTPAEVSLAWLLSRPQVAAPIIGATKLHHLEAAVKAVELTLQPEEIQALQAPYQPHGVKM
jgi:1-deoxyxylulose-5-phosphate synthase